MSTVDPVTGMATAKPQKKPRKPRQTKLKLKLEDPKDWKTVMDVELKQRTREHQRMMHLEAKEKTKKFSENHRERTLGVYQKKVAKARAEQEELEREKKEALARKAAEDEIREKLAREEQRQMEKDIHLLEEAQRWRQERAQSGREKVKKGFGTITTALKPLNAMESLTGGSPVKALVKKKSWWNLVLDDERQKDVDECNAWPTHPIETPDIDALDGAWGGARANVKSRSSYTMATVTA